ncbi:hypothetical protein [Agriterribacter sp.]|uniref:hypothetical protein n=1 Tax=Agriterribacter sp. TaxID=2821509 RepID=UPI002D0302BC|nr:hypothetical protein [Agriterribacter sp.]HTN05450.1 hypothetical protein [Agriterribacter sp.]
MNLKPLLILLTGALLVISCRKEESFEKKKAEDDNKGPLLVKTTMQSSGASYLVTVTFKYDAKKRLLNVKNDYEGTVNEPYAEQESSFIRNDKGMIKTITDIWNVYDEGNNLILRDSIALNLNFTAEGKYTYGIRTFLDTDNKKIRDSIAYEYNSKGRISRVKIFRKTGDNTEYKDFQNTGYTYDEKENITTMTVRFFENDPDPQQVINFQYNDKLAPMNFKDEALLNGFLMDGLNTPHCLTGISDITEPDNTWNMSYEYNDFNKPAKGVYSNDVTQEKVNLTYFYQK